MAMTRDISPDIGKIRLLLTEPHNCSYLSDQQATTAFVDPDAPMDTQLYAQLSTMGFRRSGPYLYSPFCKACNACISARIPVNKFRANRSQRRCLKRNADISITPVDSISFEEHYPVYENYISERHNGGDMYPPSRGQFEQFLVNKWGCTKFLEFRLDGTLIGTAVVDQLPTALSAIYTYFLSQHSGRSLGTLAILFQIELAKKLSLDYLYLGYWISDCQKMSYKAKYKPLEILQENTWQLSE